MEDWGSNAQLLGQGKAWLLSVVDTAVYRKDICISGCFFSFIFLHIMFCKMSVENCVTVITYIILVNHGFFQKKSHAWILLSNNPMWVKNIQVIPTKVISVLAI